ncbi:hypothetical protein [Leptospira idonii]|uniref:Lipoprotein n=1 Tax=Leptospira idonii TaxID=1193500 RepID=A0A4R9LXM3_9LEPT|nr:hypothetical protein [Leptospira idonii]TGN19073.1 hypothetical protein EHS15_11750 [Leptospira idonii]
MILVRFLIFPFSFVFFLFGCSTERSPLPRKHLTENVSHPEFVDGLTWDSWVQPKFGKQIQRPTKEGERYFVLFRDRSTQSVLRSVCIEISGKNHDFSPKQYLYYPFAYTFMAGKGSLELFNLRHPSGGYPNYNHNTRSFYGGRYAANAGVLIVVAGVFVVGTVGGFVVGLGKGTYELTGDLYEEFSVSSEEIVLGYNDYEYDSAGNLIGVSSYLPYHSITSQELPVYDLTGESKLGNLYPKMVPTQLVDVSFQYDPKRSKPKSAIYTEFFPEEKKKKISLPLKKI